VAPIGCWPEFKDQRQELAYLEDLSNPTPSQWTRREELRKQKGSWAPELNTLLSIPEDCFGFNVYPSVDAVKKIEAMINGGTWYDVAASNQAGRIVHTPEWEAATNLVRGHVGPGARFKVLYIGDDYVNVRVITNHNGVLIYTDGCARKWWVPRDRQMAAKWVAIWILANRAAFVTNQDSPQEREAKGQAIDEELRQTAQPFSPDELDDLEDLGDKLWSNSCKCLTFEKGDEPLKPGARSQPAAWRVFHAPGKR
jgi:hypothetical protein